MPSNASMVSALPTSPHFMIQLAAYQGEQIDFSLIRATNGESYAVTIKPDFAERAGFVQVLGVVEESPAAKAGILPGDLVVKIAGSDIPSSSDPASRLSEAARDFAGRLLPLYDLARTRRGTD